MWYEFPKVQLDGTTTLLKNLCHTLIDNALHILMNRTSTQSSIPHGCEVFLQHTTKKVKLSHIGTQMNT